MSARIVMNAARTAGLTGALALSVLAAPAVAPAQDELTVYSSLPLQGASRPQTTAVVAGARRALRDASFRAAGIPVRYVSLDDSTAAAGTWTPAAVARNARRAAQDSSAIAYIGEFNSGASAISMPILNEAGLLQISPSNTYVGLTRGGPGAERGEPTRYLPAGHRTYGRIVPNDHVQGRAGAALLRSLGRSRIMVVHDGERYGRGVARVAARALRRRGATVVGFRKLSATGRNARSIARAARRADGLFYGGITANSPADLWRRLAGRPRLVKVASDGVAESGFVDPREGGIGARAARNTYVLVATLAPSAYPAAGQQLLQSMGRLDPYALYGYEAMSLALDAVNRGGPSKDGAVAAFFATRDRDSVIGRYSIDAYGDTTATQYGVYRIQRRQLVFDRAIDAAAASAADAPVE
jgi:branched-chain amino acid transport system substrate-binding protein